VEPVLANLIEQVPTVSSGRVVYDATDSLGRPLGLLNPIPSPDGGYLGVYQIESGGTALANYDVVLGQSQDLLHWSPVAVLDTGASSPTLRPIPGGAGYLLAEEKYSAAHPFDQIRLRYFRTTADLYADRDSGQIVLPRQFSPYADGTPSFLSIAWHGRLSRSVIELGFHYLPFANNPDHQGPDREAIGVLTGFRKWSARRDWATDGLLDQAGLTGKHGDRRQFSFDGQRWRVYEGQTSYALDGFANWSIALYSVTARRMYPLTIDTRTGAFATSFGGPTVQVEPAPGAIGSVLVVTMYVFPTTPGEGGELVYYQPLP
jgi:hypothetical protein